MAWLLLCKRQEFCIIQVACHGTDGEKGILESMFLNEVFLLGEKSSIW